MSRRVGIGAIFLALLLAIVAWEWTRLFLEGLDVPDDSHYVDARALVARDGATDADAVFFLPAWSLRGWPAFRTLPVGFSDQLAEQALHRFRRVYVVVEPDGTRAFDQFRSVNPDVRLVGQTGVLRVFRLDVGSLVAFDLRDRVSEAKVAVLDKSGVERVVCDEVVNRGLQCRGRPDWQRVVRQHVLVTENGQHAIWAHPPPDREQLVVRYDDIPLGPELVLSTGFTRTGSKDPGRPPVEVAVTLDGEEILSVRVPRKFRWETRTVPLPPAAIARGRGQLELRFTTSDNGNAHFAFDGFVTRAPGSGR